MNHAVIRSMTWFRVTNRVMRPVSIFMCAALTTRGHAMYRAVGVPDQLLSAGVLDMDDMGGHLHPVFLLHRLVLRGHVGRVDQQPGQVGMHGLGGRTVSLILSESDIGLPSS
jgi:hypothetical protein